jgi:4-hydroxy-3-polyprenylbenzoate decarboxylase
MAPMMHHGLADFLEDLRQSGELLRVDGQLDPVLEVAAATDRVRAEGNPAMLFGAVKGHDMPVLTNLLADESRICRALRVETVEELALRVAEALEPSEPEGWLERLKPAAGRGSLKGLAPRIIRNAPSQQVVRLGGDVDLGRLPVLQSCRDEAGRNITAGQVFCTDPGTGRRAAGRYDLQVLDRQRLAIYLGPHDEPSRLLLDYGERHERMPLAVALGGDPAALLAAMAPLPDGADALLVAGLLRGRPLEVVTGRSIELVVPAEAEIVLEGFLDPAESPVEAGPRYTASGHCSPPQMAPVLHVTGLTHRANPIYPALVPGPPPNEQTVIGRAMLRAFLPMLRATIPEIVSCDLPQFGAARHWALVSIRKTYAGQARKVAGAVWGLRSLMFAKVLVLVDEDVDVYAPEQAWSAITRNVDAARDVFFQAGPPDPLDPAAPPGRLTRRMAIDATAKLPGEGGG